MGPTPPIALPPVTAEYASTLQQAEAQVPPAQSAYRFSRAGDGKTRVDSGNISVISNPATAQTVLLDHLKKTATMQPAPAMAPPPPPPMPQMPKFTPPGLPAQPQAPTVKVEDLGKRILQGHEVEGKRFVTQPEIPKPPALTPPGAPPPPQIPGMPKIPAAPQIAGMPKVPAAPEIPGMPKVPGAPQMAGMPKIPTAPQIPGMPKLPVAPAMPGMPPPPAAPPPPTTTEVWSSTSMGVPMLMKMTGGFGQLTQVCKSAVPGEPHPAAFQIPHDYKVIGARA